MFKLYTLVFIKNKNNELLMGYKTRGFGVGQWNGFGGKVEPQENIEQCAIREVREECGLCLQDLIQIGVLRFEIAREKWIGIVHVFTSCTYQGSETPSEEMNPLKWFKPDEIPLTKMWPDVARWMPYVLEDSYFYCYSFYDENLKMTDVVAKRCDSLKSALEVVDIKCSCHFVSFE